MPLISGFVPAYIRPPYFVRKWSLPLGGFIWDPQIFVWQTRVMRIIPHKRFCWKWLDMAGKRICLSRFACAHLLVGIRRARQGGADVQWALCVRESESSHRDWSWPFGLRKCGVTQSRDRVHEGWKRCCFLIGLAERFGEHSPWEPGSACIMVVVSEWGTVNMQPVIVADGTPAAERRLPLKF